MHNFLTEVYTQRYFMNAFNHPDLGAGLLSRWKTYPGFKIMLLMLSKSCQHKSSYYMISFIKSAITGQNYAGEMKGNYHCRCWKGSLKGISKGLVMICLLACVCAGGAIQSITLFLLGKHSTTEPHPSPSPMFTLIFLI